MPEEIDIGEIVISERNRVDYGDLGSLVESIKEYGMIQPIVLTRTLELVAGGRRLKALGTLLKTGAKLRHSKEFVFTDEVNPIRLKAMELEENLKRKDLSWSEIVLGKKQLLEIMQSIHGEGTTGRPQASWKSTQPQGFSQKSLSEMLGEHPTQTSRDLELAGFVVKFPDLAKLPTRADASRKLGVAITVAAMQNVAKQRQQQKQTAPSNTISGPGGTVTAPPVPVFKRWTLVKGDFFANAPVVPSASVDLVLTDLPYNIGLGDSTAAHGAGLGKFKDTITDPIKFYGGFAAECYRILHDHRFAVVFFGFGDYGMLVSACGAAGFTVEPYPFIWLRDRTAPPDGTRRYSKTYDPALILSKGDPRFVRPNQANAVQIPSVRGADRLHAAQKPVEVMERFVLDMTVPDAVIVDPMAGAGTTGVAAVKNKRNCILFELEHQNCVLIESRLGVL